MSLSLLSIPLIVFSSFLPPKVSLEPIIPISLPIPSFIQRPANQTTPSPTKPATPSPSPNNTTTNPSKIINFPPVISPIIPGESEEPPHKHGPKTENSGTPQTTNPVLSPIIRKQTSSGTTGTFVKGAVSLRFDDGWESQYKTALPILNAADIRGTFYITSKQIRDNGYRGFVSKEEIRALYETGHEIGAHTQSHPRLAELTEEEQKEEIAGSKGELEGWNVGRIESFSYPYGNYNETTLKVVEDAGFSSAVSVIEGDVTPTSDHLQLEHRSIEKDTTPEQIIIWIDNAIKKQHWLILTFHRIDTSGDQYSITPSNFKKIVDYVASQGIQTLTVSEAIRSMK